MTAQGTGRRVALVTGASRGIGRCVALALAAAGHDVAVAARGAADAESVRAELETLGVRAAAVTMDVVDAVSVGIAVGAVRDVLGDPAVLVNNAGVASASPFGRLEPAEWDRTLAVNATGPFLVTRACLPAMLDAAWGRVINVASTAALRGFAYTAHYTASKHALLGMTRALAIEVAARGVTVNCVCPGFVDTEMTAKSIENIARTTGRTAEQARKALEDQSPQRRLMTPGEVAAAVVYLASEEARGVNGQALELNG